MLISTVLLICLDDCITWCGTVGCFIWWRKYSCLCFGFLLCLCSWCYCNPQAAKSFQQFFHVIWFSFWLMTGAALIKVTTNLIVIISSHMNIISDFQRDWLCHYAYVSYSYQRNYTFHIQIHSFFPPLWVSVSYVEYSTSLF